MKDFKDIIDGRKVRPVHPGEVIADVLEDLGMTQAGFAKVLGVSRRTVNEIVQGQRPITVDMAIRIGKAFGNGPQLWINLQRQAELLALIERAAAEGWTTLNLPSRGLRELPPEIGQLTNLQELDLGGNYISTIPAAIGQLTNLQKIDFSRNEISVISDEIGQLINLRQLNLWKNGISVIPDAIGQLTNLQELYLSCNRISVIPDTIGQLTNLQKLDLNGKSFSLNGSSLQNRISVIPDVIGQLTNLQELDLSRNEISVIPDAIGQLTNLKQLDLSGNRINVIPDAIGQLTNLQKLDLRGSRISVIPDAIGQLTNLQELDLSGSSISVIPDEIGQLTNLKQLFLDSTDISTIPAAIGQLTNLEGLFLGNFFGNGKISVIPDVIGQLTNLQWLDLNGNKISVIPDVIGQLTNLQWLDLSNNQISEIPATIGQLTNLQGLYLRNFFNLPGNCNQISVVPDVIGQLTNLQELRLSNNQISEIPATIGQLTNLQWLDLSENKISEVPATIGQLTNLQKLYLDKNKLHVIPIYLGNLSNLKELKLNDNPLPIAPEILCGPVTKTLNYFRQLRKSVRPLHEAKILLVGQPSVGKTSLTKRLIDHQFNPNEAQTDGLNVRTWNIRVNRKDIRLNVWDFGGQEIYHATHQFFLTKRSLYLLVCDCRNSEEQNRLEYWLKLIESFGDQAPVIIIGNKNDEQPLDINRKALRNKYPNIKAILETSCLTNHGINTLRQTITQEIAALKEVYDLLPLSWFQVKEQLEELEQDFISYAQYIGICINHAIPEDHNQEQLIDLLHRLGTVLNFRDHPLLQNTNVLNPDWVTQGIYALLSDNTLKTDHKGILIPADLNRILNPQRYPPNRHAYLIEVMKEFQLCFPLGCTPPQYLIPGLLPPEEPANTDLDGDTLDFQYHYRILPTSVLSRFIVLSHDKIHNHTYWRSGVLLAYREGHEILNLACIRGDLEDRTITLTINGRKTTRRPFLAILRDTFTKIHNSYGNLEVSEWVPVPGYPNHPPLDYQELLGLEAMGEREYPIGKLRIKINLRQLLDGYEPL